MIPPADITNLISNTLATSSSVAPAVSPSLDSGAIATALTDNSQNILTQVATGSLLQAQVLTQLQDGSYIVGVNDTALRMSLPEGTTVGSRLQMTFLGDSPRPTFMLESQSDANSASLSSAAKIISNVLQTASEANAPSTLVGKTPILPEPAADSPHIANAMQDSVEFSGLFYESHVSQWASGERPISDLMREPQMQAPENDKAAAQGTRQQNLPSGNVLQRPTTNAGDLAKLIDNARASVDSKSTLGQTLNTLLSNAKGLPQEADTMVKPGGMTADNAQNINLQLNALEQNRYAWQGELWPGQHMQWEIQEEENKKGQANTGDADQSSWNSTVRFELPNLGKVSATIHLSGGHVQMRVAATSADTAKTLKANGKSLADALGDAGSPLDTLLISQDEQA